MINITPVVEAVITLLAVVITGVLLPILKNWLNNKVGAQSADLILSMVDILVTAAEQTFSSSQGEEKKKWVIEQLEAKGMVVDETVDSMIEAKVLELHAMLK